MLDYTKIDSYRFKADSHCKNVFFCFHTNFVVIGVLRYKGRFGLDYVLVSSNNIPKNSINKLIWGCIQTSTNLNTC